MEGIVTLEVAAGLFGKAFIGPEELSRVHTALNIEDPLTWPSVPPIPFSYAQLAEASENGYLLVLFVHRTATGAPLSILELRSFFGLDPARNEPCIYNQDWYVKEALATRSYEQPFWFLLRREVDDKTRGRIPAGSSATSEVLPTALVCSFVFFAYHFHAGDLLWAHDYVWCSDTDANGDRIYVGRYFDKKGVNKNGFSIHRHLSITPIYGSAPCIGA